MAETKEDGGDEKSMSLDEFRQEMFRSLRDTGTAQLRRKFIEKLQQHGMKDRYASCDVGVGDVSDQTGSGDGNYAADSFAVKDSGSENNRNVSNNSIVDAKKRVVTQWSGDEKLVNGVLFDYFDKKALEHSAAVFVPEIGGAKSYVAADTILQETQVHSQKIPLIVLLLHELSRHMSTHTMDSGTQTALDCHDHRFALENQLRWVETAYLLECESEKHEPKRPLEERMFQYQSECDALAEKRVREEIERFKAMELALMRVEERKKYEKEADKLRASLLQEHKQKSERLQEKERDLELAFVAKRTELETSLFETRQSLFQEMEKLRVKEAQLQVKVETDFRNFAAETKHLQLWEETTKAQERNLERLVAQAICEKEHELQLEKSKLTHLLKVKEEELAKREAVLNCEKEGIKTEKVKHKALQDDLARMEEALSNMEQSWKDACKAVARLEKEKKRLQDDMDAKETNAEREKGTLQGLSTSNARLTAERELLQSEIERYKAVLSEHDITLKQLALELKDSQQQLLAIKMEEANALVSERKRFMKALDDDREQFQWKENELLAKLRDFQSRLAESEAAVEKFHSQYEDEKLHVESLRQEVTNLNALLSQAQATINAKHGSAMSSSASSHRAPRNGSSSEMGIASGGFGGSDRMLMMRMMEMMMSRSLQSGNPLIQNPSTGVQPQQSGTYQPVEVHPSPYFVSQTPPPPSGAPLHEQTNTNAEHDDARRLEEEQQRIERELLEQREYERKKAERMAQEEREIAERKRVFDEELARQRQARLEEDERLETERRRKLAAEEEKMQLELEKQRKALQDAAELQQRLVEERSAADKQRLQDEQAYQECMRAENLKLEQELEAKRLQRFQEEEKEEAQAEQRRKEAQARKTQQEEEEEKANREIQRQREEAALTAAAAAESVRVECAEQELRRQQELENEKQNRGKEEQERAEREQQNRRSLDEKEKKQLEIQDAQMADQQQGDVDDEVASLRSASLESLEEVPAVMPPIEGESDAMPSQLEEEEESTIISKSEATAQEHDKTENLANELDQDPQEGQVEIADTAPAEEGKPKELAEEEQRQAAEEEKKKQDDATMDVYRQRVLARKAAEKQKQLEMEAEAERRRKEAEEEAQAERQRQQHQQDHDSNDSEQELELSGGSFAESRNTRGATMTLDYEIRATRRPLPRQLEVSDWSSESAKASASTSSSRNDDSATNGSLLAQQSRLSSGTSFPSAYSSQMPTNRYDMLLSVNNQKEWWRHDPSQRKSYSIASESDHSTPGTRHSASSVASIDWKHQRDPQKRDSWDSSPTTRSPEYDRSSRLLRKQERNDDAFDNQREDKNHPLYSGRRDSFVDVSPLRYQREEKSDDDYSVSASDEKYLFGIASTSLNASSGHGKMQSRSPRELNQDRAFFSPFRTADSTRSASPESIKASESDGNSLCLSSRRRTSGFGSESGSEYNTHDSLKSTRSVGEESRKTRRALFPATATSLKASLHSEEHGESVRSDSAPPSPTSSLSSDTQSPPSHEKVRVDRSQSPTTPAAMPLRDPILSMAERREELYSFRKKMREAFARVDEMIDAHRDFFKSDPESGAPIFDAELAKNAEQMADSVFADLAGLRERFRQLATDFQDSEVESKAASLSMDAIKSAKTCSSRKHSKEQRSPVTSDDDDNIADSSDESEVASRCSTLITSSSSQRKPTFALTSSMQLGSSSIDGFTIGSAHDASSVRSSSPTFASSHRHSHTCYERGIPEGGEEQDGDLTRSTVYSEDEGDTDTVSAIMNDNFSELPARISSRASYPPYTSTLHSRESESKASDTSSNGTRDEDGNVFKDFDKRMEEIRASLHSIARGRSKEPTGSTAASQSTASAVRGHRERNASANANAPFHSARGGRGGGGDFQSDASDDDDDPLPGRDAQLRALLHKLSETGKGL